MLSDSQIKEIINRALKMFKKAHISLSPNERDSLEIVEYQGYDFSEMGLLKLTTISTERYGARYIVFFPNQTCAEHWHPDVDGILGKEETFRVLWGKVYGYFEGNSTNDIRAKVPAEQEIYFTSKHEVILKPGDQYTTPLHEKHWFQAGEEGAIAFEVSSRIKDPFDKTTNPNLKVHDLKG